VKRLRQLGEGTESWAKGNFRKQINDKAGDEITELASHLNRIAMQLESLVQTKEQLSALEERGHLARELHDTIKQQVFSAHMQLSALELAYSDKPELVKELTTKLLELNKQMQHDLTGIIQTLRSALLIDDHSVVRQGVKT
jgi:two-component system, NarL family, sensor histidine kinase LiaS